MTIRNLILEGFDEAIVELQRLRGEVANNLPLPDGDSPDQLREMARDFDAGRRNRAVI